MTHPLPRMLLIVAFTVALPAYSLADILHLKDGTTVEGELRRDGDFWLVTDETGRVTQVGADRVRSIEITPPQRLTEEQAAERLASLRRSAERMADIEQIIPRYERFIAQAEGTTAAQEAAADLQTWRERQEQGMVRVGREWVTPEQRDQLRQQALQHVEDARLHVRQGRLREAEPLIEQALQIDPQNVSAIFLRGTIQYEQDQLPAARRSFEQVNTLLPEHGPTLNNLAVILWRQNQITGALNYYDQAMMASPQDRHILDNVAEALNALTPEQRNSIAAQRVNRRFTEQDALLQRRLGEQGLYRWGGTWVNQQQLEQLQQVERQIRAELDELSREYDAVQDRIAQIDRSIEASHRSLRQIRAASFTRDREGRPVRVAVPALYYDITRDIQNLELERDREVDRLDALRLAARQVQQRMPTPRFTGIQHLAGADAVPVG